MNGHTPGPWTCRRSNTPVDGEYDFSINADGVPVLAEAFGRSADGGVPPAEANARLIAAAPELVDGCNALLGLLQLVAGRDDCPEAIREVLRTNHRVDEARAALSRAGVTS